MHFTDDQIEIRPGYSCRSFQTCDYYVGNTPLFHERTYHTRFYGKGGLLWRVLNAKTQEQREKIAVEPDKVSQWMPGGGTKAEMEVLAAKHGGYTIEEHYAPEGADSYFLAFDDTDKALAFCRTADFDRLSSMEKVEE